MTTSDSSFLQRLNLSDYDYKLPKENIALFPLDNRSESNLINASALNDEISFHKFYDIENLLPNNSLLIFNNTKVIAARLNFFKATGGKAEILLIEPLSPSTDPHIAMSATNSTLWKCFIGGKRISQGLILKLEINNIILNAKIIDRFSNEATVEFTWQPEDKSFASVIASIGHVPLPPYIKRDDIESDKASYQTVYAKYDGSVAAPTAGLHFNLDLIEKIKQKGIETADVALHVGPGTFLPVEHDDITNHSMHEEQFFVSLATIESLISALKNNKNIIAVGTTSLRTIESLFWVGVRLLNGELPENNSFFIGQWDSYKLINEISLPDALDSLLAIKKFLSDRKLKNLNCRTRIFIVPGYDFKLINGLVTNFHLPKSTLILLVAAFLGEEKWRKVYNVALDKGFRFLSYGDSSLLFNRYIV